MVFYVTLFLVSFVVAVALVTIYRVIAGASSNRHRGILPSKNVRRRRRSASYLRSSSADRGVRTPWGWKKPIEAEHRRPLPAGAGSQRQGNVGWPYRNEPYEVSGGRTLGDSVPGRKFVGNRGTPKGGIDKPWGW